VSQSKTRCFRWMPAPVGWVWIAIGMILCGGWCARAQDVGDAAGGSPGQVIVTQRAIRHIEQRHWPDSVAQGAGKFSPGITEDSLRQLVSEAVANGRVRQNSHGRPGQIYEYDFGHPIGITIDGRPAYRLRVVVNRWNQLITAFPF
jgi:hypothetical protein